MPHMSNINWLMSLFPFMFFLMLFIKFLVKFVFVKNF